MSGMNQKHLEGQLKLEHVSFTSCKHNVKTSQVIMYSDQCGGQNRNIKLALICNHIIQSKKTTVHSIDHKFLVSGHTYLACDRDFGLNEKSKKSFNEIFVPSDWIKVIINARKKNPFRVIKLNHKDFVST
nr:unnamed protein product [Callosobruchus chinensis]